MAYVHADRSHQEVRFNSSNADLPLEYLHVGPDGEVVTPASATITIYDADGTELLAETSATVNGDLASYALDTTTTGIWELAEGYIAVWKIVSGGVTYQGRTIFDVVLRPFQSQVDTHTVRAHDPDLPYPAGDSDHARAIAAAILEVKADIRRRVHGDGRLRPALLFDPSDWTLPLLYKALEVGWRRGGGDLERSQHYRKLYEQAAEAAFSGFTYDSDDDGVVTDEDRLTVAPKRLVL